MRNEKWLQKREEKIKKHKEVKELEQFEGCTFTPITHPYFAEQVAELTGLESAGDYKIVFSGQTYDLSTEADLKQFFANCIDRSGQRSIFKKNYDQLNKLYSAALR